MRCPVRCCAFLLLLPILPGGPALAQRPDFRIAANALADPSPPGGLLAAASIGERIRFGIGRFGVAERPRPRSHVEPVPSPTDLRSCHRGSAALGFSLSF